MKCKTVHIAFCCNDAYIDYMAVAAHSILAHSPQNYRYKLHIVTPAGCDLLGKESVRALRSQHGNAEIAHVQISKERMDQLSARVEHGNFNESTYYRLFLPYLLSELDECLYFDCDVCACGDLSGLYAFDLGACCAAAVLDPVCGLTGDFGKSHQEKLGISYDDRYFNAGVMVLNLKKLREMGFIERIARPLMLPDLVFADQDVLNIVLQGEVAFLPLRFNVLVRELREGLLFSAGCYSEAELARIGAGEYAILHFAGSTVNPWQVIQSTYSLPWLTMAHDVLPLQIWQEIACGGRDIFANRDFASVVDFCRVGGPVFICGYTRYSRMLVDRLSEAGIHRIECFFESNPSKVGSSYRGIPCRRMEDASLAVCDSARVIIAAQASFEGVRKELVLRGVDEKSIAYYRHKDRSYYASLRPEWYHAEIESVQRDLACLHNPDYADLIASAPDGFAMLIREDEFASLRERLFCSEWLLRGGERAQ